MRTGCTRADTRMQLTLILGRSKLCVQLLDGGVPGGHIALKLSHTGLRVCVHVYVCVHVCICEHMLLHAYTHDHACMHLWVCGCMCTHVGLGIVRCRSH